MCLRWFYLALGLHSWGRSRGQSRELRFGKKLAEHSLAGPGQTQESALKYSGQRSSCPQAWEWEATGQ